MVGSPLAPPISGFCVLECAWLRVGGHFVEPAMLGLQAALVKHYTFVSHHMVEPRARAHILGARGRPWAAHDGHEEQLRWCLQWPAHGLPTRGNCP